MNHKELVKACLNREPIDTLPFDVFEGWMWPGITSRLMERLRARDYDELLDKIGATCRWVTARCVGLPLSPEAKKRVASPHTTHGLNGAIWGLDPGLKQHGSNTGGHPLSTAQTLNDILDYPWPSPEWFDYAGLRGNARGYSEFFVIAGGFSPLFYLLSDLCGMEKTLMDMVLHPELVEALVHKITAFYKGYFGGIVKECRGVIDAIAFGDDFSSQSAMLMSPALWRRFFKPAWAELFDIARKNDLKVLLHSCGSVYEIIPDLIEIGLDVLYPVQPNAKNMELARLKEVFGDRLSFYGGVDVQDLLPFGKPEDVRREVVRLGRLFTGIGGYIMSTSHVVMEDVPMENVLALYDQA